MLLILLAMFGMCDVALENLHGMIASAVLAEMKLSGQALDVEIK